MFIVYFLGEAFLPLFLLLFLDQISDNQIASDNLGEDAWQSQAYVLYGCGDAARISPFGNGTEYLIESHNAGYGEKANLASSLGDESGTQG